MSNDYRLGQELSLCVKRLNPDNQQKLHAILCDVAGSDHELSSAFKLLFANPIYVTTFLRDKHLGAANQAALAAIADSSLSPHLSGRIQKFVSGYFGLSILDSSANLGRESRNEGNPARGWVAEQISDSDYSLCSSLQEEATLLVDGEDALIPVGSPPVLSISSSKTSARSSTTTLAPLLKPLVLISVVIGVAVAAFKIPALCEPFGLCEKLDEDIRKEGMDSSQSNDDSPTLRKSPVVTPATELPMTDNYAPTPTPPVVQQAPRQVPPSVPSTPPVAPPADDAPLRDEPLW